MVNETAALPITQEEIDAAKSEMLAKTLGDQSALQDLRTKNTAVITTMLPALLRAQLDEAASHVGGTIGEDGRLAGGEDIGAAEYVRRLIARDQNYELPAKAARSRVTKDPRAEEVKNKATRAMYADLLSKVREGSIEL